MSMTWSATSVSVTYRYVICVSLCVCVSDMPPACLCQWHAGLCVSVDLRPCMLCARLSAVVTDVGMRRQGGRPVDGPGQEVGWMYPVVTIGCVIVCSITAMLGRALRR